MSSKIFLLLLAGIFFTLLATQLISSFEFDNVASYENNDLNVKVINALGFGDELLEADLKSHTSVNEVKGVARGQDVPVMWYDINSVEGYADGLGDVQFTNVETGEERILPYYFAEVVQGEITEPVKSCSKLTNSSGTFDLCSFDTATKTYIGDTYKKLDTRDIPS